VVDAEAPGVRVGVEVVAGGTGFEEGGGGAAGYIVVFSSQWYPGTLGAPHPKIEVRRRPVPRSRPPRVLYEQLGLPIDARSAGVDVLLSTGNVRPLVRRTPNVLALHAIQHFLLGGDIGRLRSAYVRAFVPRSVRTADRVIAVTETLRRDTIELFGVEPERIVAVPMGPSPWVAELAAAAPEPYRPPGGSPYVLCISRLYALKNHARLIAAFGRLVRDGGLPHVLVIVGGDADVTRDELAATARKHGVAERVLLLGRMPQADVPGLYAGAEAVAYPSLYETFGHPVLEAFATGTALVTSSAGATAEVAGGAARLVDPEDEADIAAGLHEVLTDTGARERLVAAGRRRVRDFSWEACARGTVDALVSATASPRR
jgi:glycosyltransferase involved in cell wall biosynthesis